MDEQYEAEIARLEHRLEGVFFDLLRDHLPAGKLERIVQDLEVHSHSLPYKYADGDSSKHLGRLARHLARRVLAVEDPVKEDGQ